MGGRSGRTLGGIGSVTGCLTFWRTFLIDDVGGVFMTSVDLFFGTKDSTIPVTIQIQEMVKILI